MMQSLCLVSIPTATQPHEEKPFGFTSSCQCFRASGQNYKQLMAQSAPGWPELCTRCEQKPVKILFIKDFFCYFSLLGSILLY